MKKTITTLFLVAFIPAIMFGQKSTPDRELSKQNNSAKKTTTINSVANFAADHNVFSKYAPCDTILTTLAGGNGLDGIMFNVVAVQDIIIKKFYPAFDQAGTAKIFYKNGSWAGNETNAAAWTYIDSAAIIFTAVGSPSDLPIHVNVKINAGDTMAFYITGSDGALGVDYTNGTTVNGTINQDSYIKVLSGYGANYPFGGGFSPRNFNGYVDYCAAVAMSCDTISTTWAGGNGNDGCMFDVTALNNITINYFYAALSGTSGTMKIYEKAGSYVGSETIPGDWTLIDSTFVVSGGSGAATLINIPVDINIPTAQTHAFYITGNGGALGVDYTNGTTEGAVFVSDGNIAVKEGKGNAYPFGGSFTPRVFNGSVDYCIESPTGVSENTDTYGIKVYPNPFTSVFTVSVNSAQEKELNILVFDLMGRLVFSNNLSDNTQQIDLSNQPGG
ncbi:MAG: T9SS type A sorting domain-containing protein, partial [Bacteroidota bacterium]